MTKNDLDLTPLGLRLILAAGASALAMGTAGAWAQNDADDDRDIFDDGVELIEDEEETESTDDEIVVTGSRLRRSTFNSISPIQIIGGESSREIGLLDAEAILQTSTAATGQQIDNSFQGFVLDNGPGATTVDLRGLGAGRTLVLVNGRRLAPAGVEGAPTAADIGLIPNALVERYEVLLDGASSIYGSDAVAGVVNAVLRKDFDGLELQAAGSLPIDGGGERVNVSAVWGKNTDRGLIGFGADYNKLYEATLNDRGFTRGCLQNIEETTDGEIRTIGLNDQVNQGQRPNPCVRNSLVGRFFVDGPVGLDGRSTFGSVYFVDGAGNTGIPGFSESTFYGQGVDRDGDGEVDIDFADYSLNGRRNDQTLIPDFERFTLFSYGEYTLEGDMNVTPYYDALFSKRNVKTDSGALQFFPQVPASNPFNPCNPEADGGVDCAEAFIDFANDPEVAATFLNVFGRTPAEFQALGVPVFAPVVGAREVLPIVSVDGDRDNADSELFQARFVAGVQGDLPQLQFGSVSDVTFDVSASYSRSEGEVSRRGIREDRLNLALGWNPAVFQETGQYEALDGGPCAIGDVDGNLPADDTATGCVPVNLFAPSLYNPLVGDFATQAERNYLFGSRDFETTVEQTIFAGFVQGTVLELPAGDVSALAGVEYRIDAIDSSPNVTASEGLLFGFFRDEGAEGERWTREAFFETSVPLLAAKPLIQELQLDASARFTDDEFYGSAWTYSLGAGWRPVDSLLLRSTFGTSFRAPNLRELFLRNLTGFANVGDPCVTPLGALEGDGELGSENAYDRALDPRSDITLANCTAAGIDPTDFAIDADGVYQSEIGRTGVVEDPDTELEAETSESFSAGFVFEQPFFDSFDMTIGATYYDLEIEGEIIELTPTFVTNECYTETPNFASTFCDNIQRDPVTQRINFVRAGFANRDRLSTAGLDLNAFIRKEFELFDEPVTLSVDIRANRVNEFTTEFVGTDTVDIDELAGTTYFPEWNGQSTAVAAFDKYRMTWQARYVGSQDQFGPFVDPFDDVFGQSNTCLGPDEGDVLCRDFNRIDDYMIHSASFAYVGESVSASVGVRNLLDRDPPQVNDQGGDGVVTANNTVIGGLYDLNGRTFFMNIQKRF